PGNWAYFTFGHKPEPYNATAKAMPTAACAACHQAAAAEDMVFTQYYPVLRAHKGGQ
ncbi:MAG: cytochrome P460 family protein, partial [Acidiferrobacterales bacterium]